MSSKAPREAASPAGDAPIMDAVFGARPKASAHGLFLAFVALSLGAHGLTMVVASRTRPSLEAWSAEMAAEIHTALTRYERVEVEAPRARPEPPPEPPPTTAPEPPAPLKAPPAPKLTQKAPSEKAQAPAPAPSEPSAAATVISAPDDAPLDFTGQTIATGSASAYAGGATQAAGTGTTAGRSVTGPAPSTTDGTKQAKTTRAAQVGLADGAWQCAWPEQARAGDDDEQHVVLRALVDEAGRAREVTVLSDPGQGFGEAARSCALRTRFSPARDEDGRAIRALSPPIRVRFTR